ncbi:hypothetical protein RDWZM_002444 [Blomia tropicalis]|uniref:Pre-mRNA-splicing factor ISY1 n=1 Tax=Blomia tropicalis TaxID=40697 RepID=A0A9Q0RRJ8_BLOTA|nr:hypothetical protein RDWZM_002444 [Blomia tropicalis]
MEASQIEEQQQPKERQRRPYFASDCDDVRLAQKWRLDIIREISRKVTQIQNAGLGEHRIRDLNDQINKLLREKKHWEQRIKELGGVEIKGGPKFDASAREAPGNRGYKYFGAAKDLPGVRGLFSEEPTSLPKKTRAELIRNIDADYYGYRDEDDGIILKEEAKVQQNLLLKLAESIDSEQSGETIHQRIRQICKNDNDPDDEDGMDYAGPKNFISHVPSIPSQQEIHDELMRRKKQELLEKYVSSDIIDSESDAKKMLGIE